MPKLPDHEQQIIIAHAAFICEVVACSQNRERRAEFEELMRTASDNGWHDLVRAIRLIVAGQRDLSAIVGLDLEDRVIAEAVMRGIQNPATLPDPRARPDPGMAAPGLAAMIRVAASGNVEALTLISNMADQMSRAGGSMAQLASVIRPLINGERDPKKLCRRLNEQTRQIVMGILEDLERPVNLTDDGETEGNDRPSILH